MDDVQDDALRVIHGAVDAIVRAVNAEHDAAAADYVIGVVD